MTTYETWIARPGELIRPRQAVSELATRVGGLPTYPDGCKPPSADLVTCQACGKPLALLLQAHAPLTVDQVGGGQPARFLYVFGCTTEECGKQPGCFRALRLTLASEASSSSAAGKVQEVQQQQRQQAAATAAAARPTDERRVSCAADDWGMGGAGDWGEAAESDSEAVAGSSAAAFDFGDLNAALDAVGNAAVAAAPKRRQTSGGSSGSPGQPVYAAGQPCLPAFYLFAETEARCSKGSSSGGAGHEEDRLAALMAQYEAEAAAAIDAAADAAPAPTAAALAAGVCSPGGGSGSGGGSEAAETWGGEGYEEDAVLAPAGARQRAAGAAYLKFSKQVARCPDQCARYSYGGTPIWPAAQPPAPPAPCAACGAPRLFELQLMAPLIHGLAESAEWLAAEGDCTAAAGALLQPPDSWEWLTVAVFSCSRGCDTRGAVAEEAVALANEDA